MRNEKRVQATKNEGSAWSVLFTFGAILIVFFAFPLLALQSSFYDKIDQFGNTIDGQIVLGLFVLVGLGFFSVRRLLKWIKD